MCNIAKWLPSFINRKFLLWRNWRSNSKHRNAIKGSQFYVVRLPHISMQIQHVMPVTHVMPQQRGVDSGQDHNLTNSRYKYLTAPAKTKKVCLFFIYFSLSIFFFFLLLGNLDDWRHVDAWLFPSSDSRKGVCVIGVRMSLSHLLLDNLVYLDLMSFYFWYPHNVSPEGFSMFAICFYLSMCKIWEEKKTEPKGYMSLIATKITRIIGSLRQHRARDTATWRTSLKCVFLPQVQREPQLETELFGLLHPTDPFRNNWGGRRNWFIWGLTRKWQSFHQMA